MEKDFYEILGADKNLKGDEFKEDIRKKYKKLALKYHPDRLSKETEEKRKEGEEKFKEISEAYNTLSDDNKRAEYDMKQNGFGGFNPFEDFNPFENFNPFRRQRGPVKADPIETHIYITFEEAYKSVTKKISYKVETICDECNGTGSADGKTHNCTHCNGRGFVETTHQRGNFMMTNRTVCPVCGGTGKSITNKCKKCGGSGKKYETKNVDITIPKGIYDGAVISLNGIGNKPNDPNGINGDVYVVVHVMESNKFKRHNNDVYTTLSVSMKEALLGCEKQVETVDGKKLLLRIPELTHDSKTFVFKGYGFDSSSNMYVTINYEYPDKLTDELREAIEKL